MNNERDTHFLGFASLVIYEMHKSGLFDSTSLQYDEMHLLIAQCAYDLVRYTIDNLHEYDLEDFSGEGGTFSPDDYVRMFSHIPDLTAWPED